MNNNKILKIEVHKDNALQASSFVANQKKYLQDISSFHNKLKEKLKDRHRIRGVFFSEPKANVKNKLKRSKKYKLGKDEKNYKLSMKNYNDLKHEIFLKQKKEREEIEIKKIFDEKQVKKDLNYTNIKEFMYTFLRFKKKSNLYRENIKKNEINLRSTNKMKKNFVNQSLKNVVLHFQKVRGKVDSGHLPFEQDYDEAYDKLVNLIAKSRIKIMNKLKSEQDPYSPKKSPFSKRQSAKNLNSSEKKSNNKSSLLNLLFKDEQSNKDNNSSYVDSAESNNENENDSNVKSNLALNGNKENEKNENEIKENGKNEINEIKENKLENEKENEGEKNASNYENKKEIKPTKKLTYMDKEPTDENYNNKYKFRKSNYDKKYKNFLSDKRLIIDLNNNNFFKTDSRAQRFNNMKFDTNTNSTSHLVPNQEVSKVTNAIYNYRSNKNIMNNIFTFNNNDIEKKIIETEKNTTPINNSNENTNSVNQNSKINKSSESFNNNARNLAYLNNIKKMKKNKGLLMSQKQKNPIYWNNNYKRAQTAGHRCSTATKVKNKPFYANKIEDLIKEYNRIKSSTRKSKKKMKENLFITVGNIDKIASIKEDMLMFNLKMKYFKCGYPKAKVKTASKRKVFTKKIKNVVEMMDNPFNYDFQGFDDESSYDNNNINYNF